MPQPDFPADPPRTTRAPRVELTATARAVRAIGAASALAVFALTAAPLPLSAQEMGRVGVDWVGNDIVIEALADPKVQGVTCHISYFDRSLWDRVSKGNWFEDPSNSSIACRQTGAIVMGHIDMGRSGEVVFSEGRSLILKSLKVTRIFDAKNQVLIYLTHATEITDGSAKMSISTVPLWQNGLGQNGMGQNGLGQNGLQQNGQ